MLTLQVTPAAFDAGTLDAGVVGSAGQVYSAFVGASANYAAVPGLPVVLTVLQPSSASAGLSSGGGSSPVDSGAGSGSSGGGGGSSASTSLVTGLDGGIGTNILIPWGASALVSVSGGGGIQWAAAGGGNVLGNPMRLSPIQVVPITAQLDAAAPVYVLCTQATIDGVPVPATSVTFSLVGSGPEAGVLGTVSPTSGVTNASGCAEVIAATSAAAVGVVASASGGLPVVSAVNATTSATTPCACNGAAAMATEDAGDD
jgi:hypothetical protein